MRPDLETLLRERILVLDGAMGTMIQAQGLDEAGFRGTAYANHPIDLKGANDLLCLTRPDVIEQIHLDFLRAGADIVETNTFNAQSISLSDYGLEGATFEINKAAAEIAVRAARQVSRETPHLPRFAAGSLGPTNRTGSLSPDVSDPGLRSITFDELERAYHEQTRGLLAGGAELLIAETSFDTLNLRAALFAIARAFDEIGRRVPVIASITITDASARTLSGQTVEAAWLSISHVDLLAAGINCALGAEQMRPHVEELSRVGPAFVGCYPNAGLPNEFGGYDDTPEDMAALMGEFARAGWVNLVGGCCGTTPEHIRAIASAVEGVPIREQSASQPWTRLSGLEALEFRDDSNFIMVGERTNVTGSRKFARLIRSGDFDAALSVARHQVEGGANILDVNMDEGLLDSEQAMTKFLNLIASEPDIARIPIMIDSSKFSVLEAGLKCVQGKGVVNSISLKEGEEEFLRQARLIRRYGAAVVVMAFDEEGQAVTVERKVEILSRAHDLLTRKVGFDSADIIFDPNILTVATGIEEHDGYAVAFIEATSQLKQLFPLARVSGGVSNISFSLRGNDAVREAMHAAFLYHAIQAGMDMGIVNAGQLGVYDEIAPELLECVEDVLLNRRPDATERLVDIAATVEGQGRQRERDDAWRDAPLVERIQHALVRGVVDHVDADIAEALETYPTPLAIIEGPLMAGMNVVGDLFGAGKMFLPQVVKSARVMKRAVSILEPIMDRERNAAGVEARRTRILLATVKGDVHDIGKNIVGAVLSCNNHEVFDLGVMVPADRIIAEAREQRVDIIGLSGLITPSLDEMVHVAGEMRRVGLDLPLLIGGATTSAKHTAIRIAPAYPSPTLHVTDASRSVDIVRRLLQPASRSELDATNRAAQDETRTSFSAGSGPDLLPYPEALRARPAIDWSPENIPSPSFSGIRVIEDQPLEEIAEYIDWTPLFHVWELRGVYPRILDDPRQGQAAREVMDNARETLDRILANRSLRGRAVYGLFPANSDGDDIVLWRDEHRREEATRFHMLRQQQRVSGDRPRRSLSDFVAPSATQLPDFIGAFAVTAGHGIEDALRPVEADMNDYESIMIKALADRLAEAFAEFLHARVRHEWGVADAPDLTKNDLIRERYRGIRPAPGYPASPDHSEKETLWRLLDAQGRADIRLTENFAMLPAASVSGLYFAHPESRYFALGKIGRDQVTAYSERKGCTLAQAERWLRPNLGYEPEAR